MSLFYGNQTKPNNIQNKGSSLYPELPNPPSQSSQNKSKYTQPNKQNINDPTFPKKQVENKSIDQPLRKSILLANNEDDKQSWLTKCCSCANIQSYKKFFSVTNADVLKRISHNLQFWNTAFFNQNQQYDFYGPFWIYTTVIFCLSAVPNILLYQGTQKFDYNFQIVGIALGLVYLLGFLYPVLMTFVLKMLGVQCTYIQNICLYGYSMCICVICLLLCSINICILHYVLLGYAFATRTWFIMNNMLTTYSIPIAKKALLTGLIIGENVLYFAIIKFFIVICYGEPANPSSSTQSHRMEKIYHTRQFYY